MNKNVNFDVDGYPYRFWFVDLICKEKETKDGKTKIRQKSIYRNDRNK